MVSLNTTWGCKNSTLKTQKKYSQKSKDVESLEENWLYNIELQEKELKEKIEDKTPLYIHHLTNDMKIQTPERAQDKKVWKSIQRTCNLERSLEETWMADWIVITCMYKKLILYLWQSLK